MSYELVSHIVVYHGDDIETAGTIFGSPEYCKYDKPSLHILFISSHSLVTQKVLVLTPCHSDESKSSGRIADLQNCLVHPHEWILIAIGSTTCSCKEKTSDNEGGIWLRPGFLWNCLVLRLTGVWWGWEAPPGLEGCSVQFSGLFVEVRPSWK